jgi:hypothetical protein
VGTSKHPLGLFPAAPPGVPPRTLAQGQIDRRVSVLIQLLECMRDLA